VGAAVGAWVMPGRLPAAERAFRLRYILASCMYGETALDDLLPEVRKTGAGHIDIWPKRHANQREQVEAMGHDKFAELLDHHHVKLGMITRYDLGPYNLQDEMRVAQRFGGSLLIAASRGPSGLKGSQLKSAVREFAEKMKPHVEAAESAGVTIGIENHGSMLIDSPDSQRWLVELMPSRHLGIALAPYHLEQDPESIAALIVDLGPRVVHFYAWQHGKGCMERMPKEDELLQMPGRGDLDFMPVLSALKRIDYQGWTEVFMHPVPRGIPILESTDKVTAEINRARRHLDAGLAKV
jgi:sugar phosphate isomerase/epimerase